MPSLPSLSLSLLFTLHACRYPTTSALPLPIGIGLTTRQSPPNPGFDIQSIIHLTRSLPSHSWEYGTLSQALLELNSPAYSVFGSAPFPVPSKPPNEIEALGYAASHIQIGGSGADLVGGDGSAGDPASLGVFAYMLGVGDGKYRDAAKRQLDFLLNNVPRDAGTGAISHRTDVAEFWADFMYMAPPFIAYYGAATSNSATLKQAYDQCAAYRTILQSPDTRLWRHIVGPQSGDDGLWSTGNAWAAAGMARVLATIMKAPSAATEGWKDEAVGNLSTWIKEILDGVRGLERDEGLLRNYLFSGFGEISGSSLLAATAYRMVVLQPSLFGSEYVRFGDEIRGVLGGVDGGGEAHVRGDGVVRPAVNPLDWRDERKWEGGSPEGNTFVCLMYAAWRDCKLAGRCEAEARAGRLPSGREGVTVCVVGS